MICSVLPPFLVGSQAVQISEDLGLTPSRLGLILGLFFLVTAVSSSAAGRTVDRMGWRTSLAAVGMASAGVLLAVAFLATSPVSLGLTMMVAGTVNAVAVPTGNLILSEEVPANHHGLTFGLTQAAIPAAGIVAGAAVPAVALSLGWRWSFAICAAVPLALLALRPRRLPTTSPAPKADPGLPAGHRRAGLLLAASGGVAAAIVAVLGSFFVSSAVQVGVSPAAGGGLLVLGSTTGIAVRVVSGWLDDVLATDALLVVAGLLGLGAVGFLLLPKGGLVMIVVGTVLAFGGGWGWPAVFHLAVVRSRPHSPAAATGSALTGMAIGAAAGPLVFGSLLETTSLRTAWGLLAAVAVGAGVLVAGPTRRTLLSRGSPEPNLSCTPRHRQ